MTGLVDQGIHLSPDTTAHEVQQLPLTLVGGDLGQLAEANLPLTEHVTSGGWGEQVEPLEVVLADGDLELDFGVASCHQGRRSSWRTGSRCRPPVPGLQTEHACEQGHGPLPRNVTPDSRWDTATREMASRPASASWVHPSLAR